MNSVVYEIVFEDGVSEARRDQIIAVTAMLGVRRMVPVHVLTSEHTHAIIKRASQDRVSETIAHRFGDDTDVDTMLLNGPLLRECSEVG